MFFIVLLAIVFLAQSFYFDTQLAFHNSQIKEVGKYLKENTNPGDIVICPKAIGYYTKRRFYNNDNNKPEINNFDFKYIIKYIIKSAQNRKMDDEFFWPRGYFGGFYTPIPSQENLKKASYVVLYHKVNNTEPEKQIGKFYIYRLNK